MADNKILYGLKNCYYAKKTGSTYGTPVALPGAVSIDLTASGDSSTFYADDIAYAVFNANNGYEGSLELANIPESFYTDILGFETDDDGNLVELSTALGAECALLFEFQGDVKARRHIFWNVKFGRPSITGNTKEESIEPQTSTLEFNAVPLANGITKSTTAEGTDATAYSNWFTTAPVVPTL